MAEEKDILKEITSQEYEHGFVTDVEQEFIPKGLDEDIIRLISAKKEEPQWLPISRHRRKTVRTI